MFGYAALQHPEHAQSISRVLAIPPRRFDRALVTWLTGEELDALLAAPDKSTWTGRRDHAMIALAAQTGLRISELTGLARRDVHLGSGPHVSCHGKGRKERITPLTKNTVAVLRAWLAERNGEPEQPLFPNRTGGRLSRDAVEKRLARHLTAACCDCPSLKAKNVTALSRPGARCWCCHLPVSPDRSPNPPYRSLGNGLSTLSAVRRGSQLAMGMGSCCPGRRNG